jgi:glucuronokinase
MMITTTAYPRAGLVGNPSDGYFGRTIAFTFTNFCAEVTLYQTPELEILPNSRDHSCFSSIQNLVQDVNSYGYYGGIRLIKATIKKFSDYCRDNGIQVDKRNFTVRYGSDIPHQVGLAGSSAIITACMRALMAFYQVTIPLPALANLVLSVEMEELQISAGLQDRVAQAYEGLVYMDFDKALMERQGYGHYERLDIGSLKNVYLAYRVDLSEDSGVFHNDMRERYEFGDTAVHEAVTFWANLTNQVRDALANGEASALGPLLDQNFDRRAEVSQLSTGNLKMVEAARSCGASAKFSGSGGAIVGTFHDEAMYESLSARFESMGIRILKPKLAEPRF